MKRLFMLVLVASLLPGSAFATLAGQDAVPAQREQQEVAASEAASATDDAEARPLAEVIAVTAKEIAAEDAAALGGTTLPTAQEEDGIAGWKMVVGVGLLAGGAGLIANGIALRQEEPDPFGRVKDADSWVAIGVGGSFMTIGAFVVRDALAGRGF